jgi:hypothetical protein
MNNPDTTPPKHWTEKVGDYLVVTTVSALVIVGVVIHLLASHGESPNLGDDMQDTHGIISLDTCVFQDSQ